MLQKNHTPWEAYRARYDTCLEAELAYDEVVRQHGILSAERDEAWAVYTTAKALEKAAFFDYLDDLAE
jgi:hypothetical protein